MVTMICDGKVVKDETFLYVYDKTVSELDELKSSGAGKGYFELTLTKVKETFKFYLMGVEKPLKVVEDAIIFPTVKIPGSKQKYFISDMKLQKNRPAKNTYKTFYTINGETMPLEDFLDRSGIYNTFIRNHGLDRARSFKLNGIAISIERKPKNSITYDVVNTETGEETKGLYKGELIKFTGCNQNKPTQANMYNPVIKYKHFKIERKEKR